MPNHQAVAAKGNNRNARLPRRPIILWMRLTALTTLLVLSLLYRVRFSVTFYPVLVVDAGQKEPTPWLDGWDLVLAAVIPIVAYLMRIPGTALLVRLSARPRLAAAVLILYVMIVATIARHVLYGQHYCSDQEWMETDVGYLKGNGRNGRSLCLRTLCDGRVWEPHVTQVLDRYLFGQGRAIDVGAFVGYHTLRLAKNAAPHTVYAWEGRLAEILSETLERNNAKHSVRILSDVIGEGWTPSKELQHELLNSDAPPLVLIKIDCEGCELAFLRGMRDVLIHWHPVIVVEIQDDQTRQEAKLGGQQMIQPVGTKMETIDYQRKELGYASVQPLLDNMYGTPTWDYLALWKD